MKKITFIIILTIVSLLLLSSFSYAVKEGRIEITGRKTGCPNGLKYLRIGSKKYCKIIDPKIVDVYMESAIGISRCPDGYVSDLSSQEIRWCTKRVR